MNDENIAQKESFEEAQGILIERENQFERSYSEQVCYERGDKEPRSYRVEMGGGGYEWDFFLIL